MAPKMNMAKIGLGIIGCGSRIDYLARQLLKKGDGIEVVAVCDPSPISLARATNSFGDSLRVYDDYRDLVRDPAVDWVAVGSWNCFHRDHVVAALEAGKHVFSEKPLAISLEQCLDIGKAWKASGKHLIVGFTLRYSAHYLKIKEIVESGTIGRIVSFEFNETLHFDHGAYIHGDWRRLRSQAGSHILEKCCHDLDLANWFVGSVPSRVASFGGTDMFCPRNEHLMRDIPKAADGREPFKGWWDYNEAIQNPFTTDKDIVDNQVAILQYANGVRATFHTNCSTTIKERRMYICGTEGTIRSDVIDGSIVVQRIGYDQELIDASTSAKGGHGDGDRFLTQCWYDCMTRGVEPVTGFEDGLKSAVTAFAIDEALDTGRVVDLAEYWRKAAQYGN
jgi:predicted dehydrogenase